MSTWWAARVEWETPDPVAEDAIDLVMEHLEGHGPAVGQEPGEDQTWSATVSVEADSLDAAVTAALDLVAGATGETPTGIEVLREEVRDRRVGALKV
jgi:hypothetical protein